MGRGFSVVMLVGLLMLMGCEQKASDRNPVTSEDVRRDAGQAVDTAIEFSEQIKEDFQKRIEVRLEELDDEIAALREKGRDLTEQAKADWDRKLADLESKRDAVRAKLVEVRQSSKDAWKEVRQGAQAAWDELEKAVQDASREF